MPVSAPVPLEISALGVRIVCHLADEAHREAVRQAWQDALISPATPVGDAADPVSLTVGIDPSDDVHGRDIAEMLHVLSPSITQQAIAAHKGEMVMLHAAALADPDTGAAAVLVAASGTGKTTAARTLGRRFAYLSDETAAITPAGIVLPYLKPLSIIEEGPFKTQRSASRLGLLTTDRVCHLAALLVIDRQPDHVGAPVVTRMEEVDAIAAMAPQTSYLPSLDRPLHRLAEVIQMAGGAHHVTYREAATLQSVLEELLVGVG